MDYDEFKEALLTAFRSSGLVADSAVPVSESLNLRTTERTLILPFRATERGNREPFEVTGSVGWCWDALQTARTTLGEDNMLAELFVPDERGESQLPWLRMDMELHARHLFGGTIALPSTKNWLTWTQDAIRRLKTIVLIDKSVTRDTPAEGPVSMCHQVDPEITLAPGPTGALEIKDISIRGFQGIELPRRWTAGSNKQDKMPRAELAALFQRLKSGLNTLGQVLAEVRGSPLFPHSVDMN